MVTFDLFVPGRFCLFGEHSDTVSVFREEGKNVAKGHTLVTPIDLGIKAIVRYEDHNPAVDNQDNAYLVMKRFEDATTISFARNVPLDIIQLKAALDINPKTYLRYVYATTIYMAEAYNLPIDRWNIELEINQDLPQGIGLSSSAAICVLMVAIYNRIFNLNMTVDDIMIAAWKSERMTGSKCGRLDQIVALPERRMIHVIHDGNNIVIDNNIFIPRQMHFAFVMTNKTKNVASILDCISEPYKGDILTNQDQYIIDYYAGNNKMIVEQCISYLAEGNLDKVGELMTYSQYGFNSAVAVRNLDLLEDTTINHIATQDFVKTLTLGYKGIGAHGDRSGAFLCKNEYAADAVCDYVKKNYGIDAMKITIPFQLVPEKEDSET